jgi:hypothetical protein
MTEHTTSSTASADADLDRDDQQPSLLERLANVIDAIGYGVATAAIFALIAVVTPAQIAVKLFREGNTLGSAGVVVVMACVYGLAIRDATRRRWSWASKLIAGILVLCFAIVLVFDALA